MKQNKQTFQFFVLFCALLLPFYAQAQAVKVEDHQLDSKLMARKMPYRVALPKNYTSNPSERFPVIYLLHGLTGHYDNWGDKGKISEYLAPYNAIVVMPEGNNGWYTDSLNVPSDKYESYIVKELIPEVDKKLRTDSSRGGRVIAGLSMGGYGSLKFGLKYPEMFTLVGSFSGALGATTWSEKTVGNSWKALTESVMSVYGADDSQTRKDNDIYRIVREMPADKMKTLPFIYVDCGTEDSSLIGLNRDFATLLTEKKIPHEYRQLPGAHNWQYWEAQIQEFLQVAEKKLSKAKTPAQAKTN